MRLTLADVRRDWRCLDETEFPTPSPVRLLSHETFSPSPVADVTTVGPGWVARLLSSLRGLSHVLLAWRLLRKAGPGDVVIVNGSQRIWVHAGLLNRFVLLRRRRLLCWDVMLEAESKLKRRIFRAAVLGTDLSLVWSGKQVASHARFLDVPGERFLFIPYKSNHSKHPSHEMPLGSYVFAGGNGKRDYRCLVDAVRGSEVPVIVSATAPDVRAGIERVPNVTVVAAWEPAFAQLQQGSRFCVVPMVSTGIKGGGEANLCNAMWHRRAVIAADDMAAHEYVEDGVTGYVVPSGDASALRRRIVELWNDPEKARAMGLRGRERVERLFTHPKFIDRLMKVAVLLGLEGSSDASASPSTGRGPSESAPSPPGHQHVGNPPSV